MKEFNLEEYLKDPSQKVVTRDGREVRIICTDAKNEEPIIALVYNNNRDEENVYTYNKDGYFCKTDSCLDLFFAPPIKREGWVNIYDTTLIKCISRIYNTKEDAETIGKGRKNSYITTLKIEWEE